MAVATLSCLPVKGQEKVVPFKYGNMDHWVIRNIKESGIIGGNQKKVYAVGPNMTINGNIPYTNKGGSPWGSSNVLAHVSGIYKTNNSVFRDKHGSGYCAKLVTHIEKVKVLGLINIKVLAAGSLFLGDVREPITSTKDGPKAINWGIPFTARPKALRFDYKTSFPNAANRIKPEQAIQLFEKNTYDIVFLDIKLPDMSGFDIAYYLRKNYEEGIYDFLPPLIAFTANVMHSEEEYQNQGMDGVLRKPLSLTELRQCFKTFLGDDIETTSDEEELPQVQEGINISLIELIGKSQAKANVELFKQWMPIYLDELETAYEDYLTNADMQQMVSDVAHLKYLCRL